MLYFITNRKLVAEDKFANVIKEAIASGVDRIILREKDLGDNELLFLASKIKKLTEGYNCKLIINSNVNVAKEIKSFGLHLPFDKFIDFDNSFKGEVGVSVHSIEEAAKASRLGANYILAGHVFVTKCKEGLEPRGLDFIKEIKNNVKIPVIALGGIYPHNTKLVLESGADGIAVMSTIMIAEDVSGTVNEYKKMICQ